MAFGSHKQALMQAISAISAEVNNVAIDTTYVKLDGDHWLTVEPLLTDAIDDGIVESVDVEEVELVRDEAGNPVANIASDEEFEGRISDKYIEVFIYWEPDYYNAETGVTDAWLNPVDYASDYEAITESSTYSFLETDSPIRVYGESKLVRKVNSHNERSWKLICPVGQKAKDGQCVTMSAEEKRDRRRAIRLAVKTKKREGSAAKIRTVRLRNKAMRFRNGA